MTLHTPIRRVATLVPLAILTVLLVPGLALADSDLETANPADKSTVIEAVAEVSGLYSEAMNPEGSSLVVKDASGAVVAQGTVDPEDDTRMMATPATPLGNGTYSVESTAHSTDGHIGHATWTFVVAVAVTPPPTPVTSATATAVQATPVPSVAPTPGPSADGTSTGSSDEVLLPIVVGLIIVGGGAAYLLRRRNRPRAGL